jgi:predicted NAD-dependent protein-ADP-ribosyltransferase YbiA (DUF1768 family)
MDNRVTFYEPKQPFYEFSNYYEDNKQKLVIDGLSWRNTEQYFQAMKYSMTPPTPAPWST